MCAAAPGPGLRSCMCIISNKVFYGNSVEQPPEELELNKQANVQICHMVIAKKLGVDGGTL